MSHKQNNLKVSKPMEARRLRSGRNIINKNNYVNKSDVVDLNK